MAGTREDPDLAVKKMARALREGGTMLDLACPSCNNPIFQQPSGDKYCAVCERRVILESELENPAKSSEPVDGDDGDVQKVMPPRVPDTTLPKQGGSTRTIFDELRRVILEKLAMLVDELDHARNVQELSLVNRCIIETLDILDRLKFT